jgi:hypothetical protein
MNDLLKSLLTESNVLAAIGFAVGVAVYAYRSLSKQSAELKAQRLGDVLAFSRLAYKVVAEIAIRTPTKVDDKLALGLQKLNEALEAANKPTLTDAEAKLAALAFTGQHGEEKLSEKLSELAAPLVMPASSPQ